MLTLLTRRKHARLRMARLRPLVLVVVLAGCTTLQTGQQAFELRAVHATFAAAVTADNTATVDPFLAGQGEALYTEVKRALTDAQIATLDPRLQANAWLLRAVAAWRTGEPAVAISAATRGLAVPELVPQSRDQILLALVPALAIDSELRERLARQPGSWSAEAYAGAHADFVTATTRLGEAEALIGPATPATVIHYVAYQRWRLLTNWRFAINRLDTRAARQAAHAEATSRLAGVTLAQAIDAAATTIPEGEPLRQLLERQRLTP